jgi:hypothetical protein
MTNGTGVCAAAELMSIRRRTCPLVRLFVARLGLTLVSATAAAQSPGTWIAAGVGITQSDRLSGSAYHVSATTVVLRPTPSRTAVVDAFFQGGTMTSGPTSCVQPRSSQCFGRTDRNRIAGLSLQLRETLFGAVNGFPVFATGGGGIYRRWTRSRETWASGADFETTSSSASKFSFGYSLGVGVTATDWVLQPSVTIHAHDLLEETNSKAGSVLMSLGLRIR